MRGTWLFGLWVLACSSSDDGAKASSPRGSGGAAASFCTPGATQACFGPGRCSGAQVCVDGTGWGTCDCGGTNGSDGSASTGTGGRATGGGAATATGGKPSSGGIPSDAGKTDSGGAGSGEGGPRQLDIYVILDQSTSMSCTTSSGGTRWDAVTEGLTTFVQSANRSISVGLGYFGVGTVPILSSCAVSDYTPDVEIGPLSTNAKSIVDSIGAHGPSTNTPTLPALQSAISHAVAWKAQHTDDSVVVVLVTDGQPNSCGTVAEVARAADSGFKTSGIPTYVVGVMDASVDCGILDPNPPNVADLNTVAAAGGTRQALVVDGAVTSTPAVQIVSALNAIVADARP